MLIDRRPAFNKDITPNFYLENIIDFLWPYRRGSGWATCSLVLLVERYMRQGTTRTCSRPCAFEEIRRNKNEKKQKKSASPKTYHEARSRPATATNSRRRASKHVPRGSPYSRASSIDAGFVEISLACIHTYPHCCCCAACIRFGALFLASAVSVFSTVIPGICFIKSLKTSAVSTTV